MSLFGLETDQRHDKKNNRWKVTSWMTINLDWTVEADCELLEKRRSVDNLHQPQL